jgi:hypothetical protein
MQPLRGMKTLQKFSSVHAQLHNHFNQERRLVSRELDARISSSIGSISGGGSACLTSLRSSLSPQNAC